MSKNFCKDCAHQHNRRDSMGTIARFFTPKTMFDDRCDIREFADEVTGEWIPCVTARLVKCGGKPPMFAPKEKG